MGTNVALLASYRRVRVTAASGDVLDTLADRLTTVGTGVLADRLIPVVERPEVQQRVGTAMGNALADKIISGPGRPYFLGASVALGVIALSLGTLAVVYVAKK